MKALNKLLIVLLILLVLVGIFILNVNITGKAVKDYYTYTKAVCDENNFCQDYTITCENKELIEMRPITGASIQHSDTWQDSRKNKSEILCD